MKLILDVWEFRDWLDDKPDVGTPRSPGACPIARYCKEVLGVRSVHVGAKGVTANGKTATAPWVEKFVKAVDMRPGRVSGREAIEILDAI